MVQNAAFVPFVQLRRSIDETKREEAGDAPVEVPPQEEAPVPAPQRKRESVRRDARMIFQSQPKDQQLRDALFDKLNPKGLDGFGVPLASLDQQQQQAKGAGGKGGLFGPASKENAERALAQEPNPDPSHPYVKEKADTRRRLGQLGLAKPGKDRMFVHDVDQTHGEQVTRTLAGKTALIPGAEVTTDAPRGAAYVEGKKKLWEETAKPFGKKDASVDDFVKDEVRHFPDVVGSTGNPIREARLQAAAKGDGKKTFMNMSHGATPDMSANRIAARMMLAEKGTKLYDETVAALGHEPRIEAMPDGGKKLDGDDMAKLKKDVIYPRMRKEMETPEYEAEMKRAQAYLDNEVKLARGAGIMVFQSAMNDHRGAEKAGDPMMSATLTANTKGIVRVGATKQNGAGTADDEIAAFSGEGPVTLSASGTAIPVGVDANGKVKDVDGTSFASPIATETAYAMSAANPNLSLDQIETLMKDPRVARDIAGTTRDGAGVIDPFAAVLLAKNPKLTSAQIEDIRKTLDANPNAAYDLDASGALTARR
jgi:hypothetical protein